MLGVRISFTSVALILSTLILILPVTLNGFPFIFYDTSSYLKRSAFAAKIIVNDKAPQRTLEPEPREPSGPALLAKAQNPFFLRPITYSAFLVPFSTKLTFFLIPAAQALLASYVLLRVHRTLGFDSLRMFLSSAVMLMLLSSLPIQVGYVMPDVFTGLLIAFSFVTVRSWPTRSAPGRLFDVGLVTFLIAAHLSHIPLALALAVSYLGISLLLPRDFPWKPIVVGLWLPLALAISMLIASNALAAKKFVISESSPLFLLAKLIGDGPARAYLAESCPRKPYLLCSELDRLGEHDGDASISDYFLWNPEGAVKRIGDPRLVAEAAEISSETIRAYPLWIASNTVRNMVRQTVTFQVDDDINNRPTAMMMPIFRAIGGDLPARYLDSAQSRGLFPLTAARALLAAGLVLAATTTAYFVATRRRQISRDVWIFASAVGIGVCANGLAIGALSAIHDRYQNRVIWLLPLAAIMIAWSVLARERTGEAA